jgi:hypothetical protein
MHWLVLFYEFENVLDEVVTFEVGQVPQLSAVQVLGLVGITAGAPKRTLAGDLDRERGVAAGQDPAPRLKDVGLFQFITSLVGTELNLITHGSKKNVLFRTNGTAVSKNVRYAL